MVCHNLHRNGPIHPQSTYQYPIWFTPELRHFSKCIQNLTRNCTSIHSSHITNKLHSLKQNFHDKLLATKFKYETELIQSVVGRIPKYSIRSLTSNNIVPPLAPVILLHLALMQKVPIYSTPTSTPSLLVAPFLPPILMSYLFP